MNIKHYFATLLCLLLNISIPHCQVQSDFEFIWNIHTKVIKSDSYDKTSNANKVQNRQYLSQKIIKIYQKFISPQDIIECNFTVSCSKFGMQAIKKYGSLYGIVLTSDRIMRCSKNTKGYYLKDSETGLAVDYPMNMYQYKH